jgi:hypothetical protein
MSEPRRSPSRMLFSDVAIGGISAVRRRPRGRPKVVIAAGRAQIFLRGSRHRRPNKRFNLDCPQGTCILRGVQPGTPTVERLRPALRAVRHRRTGSDSRTARAGSRKRAWRPTQPFPQQRDHRHCPSSGVARFGIDLSGQSAPRTASVRASCDAVFAVHAAAVGTTAAARSALRSPLLNRPPTASTSFAVRAVHLRSLASSRLSLTRRPIFGIATSSNRGAAMSLRLATIR